MIPWVRNSDKASEEGMLLTFMMSGASFELITSSCSLSSWTNVGFLTVKQLDSKNECTERTRWKCIAFLSSSISYTVLCMAMFKGRDI